MPLRLAVVNRRLHSKPSRCAGAPSLSLRSLEGQGGVFDFLSQKTRRVSHPCAFFAQGWDTQTPAALAFDVDVARVERTLLSVAFDFAFALDVAGVERALLPAAFDVRIRIRVCLQAYRKAGTIVEEPSGSTHFASQNPYQGILLRDRPHYKPKEDRYSMTTDRAVTQSETPTQRFDWQRTRDAVNFAGSLASLAGIALVWLKVSSPNATLVLAIPVFLIASLFAVGVVATAYLLFMLGLRQLAELGVGTVGKVVYVSFALGVLLSLVAVALSFLYMLSIVTIYGQYRP
jgi:hypothetical protein